MKNLLLIIGTLITAVFLLANRNGRAANSGLGSTGAPGDDATVCQSCHNGPIDVKVDISILDNADTVRFYEPDKEYTVRVHVMHTGGNTPKAYGFQLVALKAALKQNGTDLKNWIQVPSSAKLTTARNGRQYVEHKDRSTNNIFDIKWKAPSKGTGPISFYAGGNGVNSDNSSSGDGSARTSVQLTEDIESAVDNFSKNNIAIYISPNPVMDKLNIQGETDHIRDIIIFNSIGRKMKEINGWNGNDIDVNELNTGIYFVQFRNEQSIIIKTVRMMKKRGVA